MILFKRPFSSITCAPMGLFHLWPKVNSYVQTCICLLTNFPIAIPMPDKLAETFFQAYLQHVYATVGGFLPIFQKVAEELGIRHQF